MSEAPKVYQAITSVMAHMAKEGIAKARANTQQNYKFRGIDDVYAALCGVLAENKLMMLPFVQTVTREERLTKSGSSLNYTILTVDFKLVSSDDGSSDTVRMVGEAMDTVDKSANKAQSAALKYAALQVFMIPTEGDNDADATTHEASSRKPTRPVALVAAETSIQLCNSVADCDQWQANNKTMLDSIDDTDLYNAIVKAWKARRAAVAPAKTENQAKPADFNARELEGEMK